MESSQLDSCLVAGVGKGRREDLPKTRRKSVGTMDMFAILIMALVLWRHRCVQNSQITYFKCMQFMVCQLYLNKAIAMGKKNELSKQKKGDQAVSGSKVWL